MSQSFGHVLLLYFRPNLTVIYLRGNQFCRNPAGEIVDLNFQIVLEHIQLHHHMAAKYPF